MSCGVDSGPWLPGDTLAEAPLRRRRQAQQEGTALRRQGQQPLKSVAVEHRQ
jgi:hypothetical protein